MTEQLIQTITAVVVSIAACLLYFAGSNFVLDKIIHVPFVERKRLDQIRSSVRPWLFIAPAMVLLGLFLLYPLLETFRLTFFNATGETYVGFSNYRWIVFDQNFWFFINSTVIFLSILENPVFQTDWLEHERYRAV